MQNWEYQTLYCMCVCVCVRVCARARMQVWQIQFYTSAVTHVIPHHAICTYTFVPKCTLLSSLAHAQQEPFWHTWRQCPHCVDLVSQKVPRCLLLPQKFGAVGGLIRLALSPGCRSGMKTLTHCLYVMFGLPLQLTQGPPSITNQTVNISNPSGTNSVWNGLSAHLLELLDELQYGESRSQTKIINLCKHKGQLCLVILAQNRTLTQPNQNYTKLHLMYLTF